jgi:hypothetical protein
MSRPFFFADDRGRFAMSGAACAKMRGSRAARAPGSPPVAAAAE